MIPIHSQIPSYAVQYRAPVPSSVALGDAGIFAAPTPPRQFPQLPAALAQIPSAHLKFPQKIPAEIPQLPAERAKNASPENSRSLREFRRHFPVLDIDLDAKSRRTL